MYYQTIYLFQIELNCVRKQLPYVEFFERGRHRREIINKSLGANTQHRHTYEIKKKQKIVDGYDSLSDASKINIDSDGEQFLQDLDLEMR